MGGDTTEQGSAGDGWKATKACNRTSCVERLDGGAWWCWWDCMFFFLSTTSLDWPLSALLALWCFVFLPGLDGCPTCSFSASLLSFQLDRWLSNLLSNFLNIFSGNWIKIESKLKMLQWLCSFFIFFFFAIRRLTLFFCCCFLLFHSTTISVQHWQWWVYHLHSYFKMFYICFVIHLFFECTLTFVIKWWHLCWIQLLCNTRLQCYARWSETFSVSHERHLLALTWQCHFYVPNCMKPPGLTKVAFHYCFFFVLLKILFASPPHYQDMDATASRGWDHSDNMMSWLFIWQTCLWT